VAKRGRKRTKKSKSMYFSPEAQTAIMDFCNNDDYDFRNNLYNVSIKPALEKLSENLIFIYGFYKNFDDVDVLKNDCVAFLYQTLHKFDPSKGSKAFSYFNVVAKNWLIFNSNKQHKHKIRNISIECRENFSNAEYNDFVNSQVVPPPDHEIEEKEKHERMMNVLREINKRVSAKNDKLCISAIITLFEHIDRLDFLNKRAVFVYIRDISGLTPKQLSLSLSSIRKLYGKISGSSPEFEIF